MLSLRKTNLVSVLKKATLFTAAITVIVCGFSINQLDKSSFKVPNPIPLHEPDLYTVQQSSTGWYKSWTRGEKPSVIQANCSLLFKGDKNEIDRVMKRNAKWKDPPDSDLYSKSESCSWIQSEFDGNFYTSKKEMTFPLAFAINVYNSPQQIFRFFKVIYRPHNVYCIHYDEKSKTEFKQLIVNMAKCLPNIIIPSKIENVIWGWHTIVDAQMNCFSSLFNVRDKYPWRYVITLCGKELPLRTNREIVQALSQLNGTSAVKLANLLPQDPRRWAYEHILSGSSVAKTKNKLGPIPFNFVMQKSIAYFALSLSFVEFLLDDQRVATFRKFMDKTLIPDEHFVSTLFKVPGVPGGFNKTYYPLVPTVSDYIWIFYAKEEIHLHCSGKVVHSICVVSSGDLHRLDYKPHPNTPNKQNSFFHNKYFMEWDHTVMDCLENELAHRNMLEYSQDNPDNILIASV